MSGIFISYRRSDTAATAGRLYDAISQRLPNSRVLVDFLNIDPGQDFAQHLQAAVDSSDIVLVLIGREWLSAMDSSGRRRLDDPNDFVRLEVAAALRAGKRAIPVLIDGAAMPTAGDLPPDLASLVRRQALLLSSDNWDRSVQLICEILEHKIGGVGAVPVATSPAPTVGGFMKRLIAVFADAINAKDTKADTHAMAAEPPFPRGPDASRRAASPSAPRIATSRATPIRHAVFVSYAEEDIDYADAVVGELEMQGIHCWIAHRDISPGEPSWMGAITAAIAASHLMVVLVSRHSMESKQVLREVTLADNENIQFLPFCIDVEERYRESRYSSDFRYMFATAQKLDGARLSRIDALTRLSTGVANRLPPAP